MEKTKVADTTDIGVGRMKLCEVAGRMILVVHAQNGEWSALDEMCPHRGGPLSEGQLDQNILTCPWHKAQFDVATGKALRGPGRADLRRYGVQVKEDGVYIDAPSRTS